MDIRDVLREMWQRIDDECDPGIENVKTWADTIEQAMREPVAENRPVTIPGMPSPAYHEIRWLPGKHFPPGTKLFAFPPENSWLHAEIERRDERLERLDERIERIRERLDLAETPCDYAECKEWADAIEAEVTRRQESYVRVLRQREDQNAEIERLKADRDQGAKDYCALSDRDDARHVEIERLESVLTDADTAMYEANAEIKRLREVLEDASEALDLAQALLERSAHHARILGAYERTRAALNTEE